ncbi:MAG: D-glycero-beta-D-manno-heptose 1,7-bisphosphate 7-phosphatase [Candidatus Omnitrophica bacterium]|nr:D-glycero-beta-D-manno-heptose 1,7-bisphosphate 7-phosphatase [Candidatus Omnitrophota bacterium]
MRDAGHAAVFLDRDGTINEEVGYLDRIDRLRLLPGAAEGFRLLNASGFKVVVVTNQSGVARGLFTEAFVVEVHRTLAELLGRQGARIDRFEYCPHHPTEGAGRYRRACPCRKPEPGMLLKAAAALAIDLDRSYVVGDTPRDLEAARRAGARGILVRTGYGTEHLKAASAAETTAAHVADDLLAAVHWILTEADRHGPDPRDRRRP